MASFDIGALAAALPPLPYGQQLTSCASIGATAANTFSSSSSSSSAWTSQRAPGPHPAMEDSDSEEEPGCTNAAAPASPSSSISSLPASSLPASSIPIPQEPAAAVLPAAPQPNHAAFPGRDTALEDENALAGSRWAAFPAGDQSAASSGAPSASAWLDYLPDAPPCQTGPSIERNRLCCGECSGALTAHRPGCHTGETGAFDDLAEALEERAAMGDAQPRECPQCVDFAYAEAAAHRVDAHFVDEDDDVLMRDGYDPPPECRYDYTVRYVLHCEDVWAARGSHWASF